MDNVEQVNEGKTLEELKKECKAYTAEYVDKALGKAIQELDEKLSNQIRAEVDKKMEDSNRLELQEAKTPAQKRVENEKGVEYTAGEVVVMDATLGTAIAVAPITSGLSILSLVAPGGYMIYKYMKHPTWPRPTNLVATTYKATTAGIIRFIRQVTTLNPANPIRARIAVFVSNLAYHNYEAIFTICEKQKVKPDVSPTDAESSSKNGKSGFGQTIKNTLIAPLKAITLNRTKKTGKTVKKLLASGGLDANEISPEQLLKEFGYVEVKDEGEFYPFFVLERLKVPLRAAGREAARLANEFYVNENKDLVVKDYPPSEKVSKRASLRSETDDKLNDHLHMVLSCASAADILLVKYKTFKENFFKENGLPVDRPDINYTAHELDWNTLEGFIKSLGPKTNPCRVAGEAFSKNSVAAVTENKMMELALMEAEHKRFMNKIK